MSYAIAFLIATSVLLSTGCGRSPARIAPGTPDSRPPREVFVSTPDGVRLFTRVVGSGADTIIVLHGGPGFTLDYLAADLEPLATRHTVIFYDQRGAGRSTLVSDSAGLSAERFVDDLEAVRAHFGLSKPTLLGHSWGVGLAALYVQRYPSTVGQLILVDGVPLRHADLTTGFEAMAQARDSGERAEMDRWMETRRAHPEDAAACHAYYRLWFRPFFADASALSRSRGDFCAGTTESRRNKMQGVDRFTMASLGNWDWRAAMATIPLRTLIIHGAVDPIPLATAEEWATTLRNARLLTFPNVGHFPYLEAPDQFFAAIATFMAGAWPAGAKPGRASRHRHAARRSRRACPDSSPAHDTYSSVDSAPRGQNGAGTPTASRVDVCSHRQRVDRGCLPGAIAGEPVAAGAARAVRCECAERRSDRQLQPQPARLRRTRTRIPVRAGYRGTGARQAGSGPAVCSDRSADQPANLSST